MLVFLAYDLGVRQKQPISGLLNRPRFGGFGSYKPPARIVPNGGPEIRSSDESVLCGCLLDMVDNDQPHRSFSRLQRKS